MKKTILFATFALIIGVGTTICVLNSNNLPLFNGITLKNLEALTTPEGPLLDCNYEIVPQDDCVVSADLEAKVKALKLLTVDAKIEGTVQITGMRECKLNKEVAMTCEPYRCSDVRKMLEK